MRETSVPALVVVQGHPDVLDRTTIGEELLEALFVGVEPEVTDKDGSRSGVTLAVGWAASVRLGLLDPESPAADLGTVLLNGLVERLLGGELDESLAPEELDVDQVAELLEELLEVLLGGFERDVADEGLEDLVTGWCCLGNNGGWLGCFRGLGLFLDLR